MVSTIESLVGYYNRMALRLYEYRWYFVLLGLVVHFSPLLLATFRPAPMMSRLAPFTFIVAVWCLDIFFICTWLHPEHGEVYKPAPLIYDLLPMFPRPGPKSAAFFVTLWFVGFPLVLVVAFLTVQ